MLGKMFGGREDSNSRVIAKERLRLVIVHDRIDVSPHLMEGLKQDMVGVISNYMDIDEQEMKIDLSSANAKVALVANIPVSRMKRGSESAE